MSKRLVRALIAGGALLSIGLVVALFHAPPVRRLAWRMVVATASGSGIALSASSLEYNLLRPWVRVEGLVVRSTASPGLAPLLTAKRLEANLNWSDLWRRRYILNWASADSLSVHVIVDTQGRDNIPRPPASAAQPAEILIRAARIAPASVLYEDQKQKIRASIPAWSAYVENNRIRFRSTQPISVQAAGADHPIDLVEATGTLRASTLHDVTLRAAMRAGKPIAGGFTVEAVSPGPIGKLHPRFTIAGREIRFDRFEGIAVDAKGGYDIGSGIAEIESLTLSSAAGQAKITGRVATRSGQSNLQAHLQAIDLLKFSPVASRASGLLTTSFPALDYQNSVTRGRIVLTAMRPAPKVVPLAGVLDVKARGFDVVASTGNLNAMGISAMGSVALAGRGLRGEVIAESTGVMAARKAIGVYLGKPSPSSIEGRAKLTAAIGGTIDRLEITGELSADELRAGNQKDISLRAMLSYNPDRVEVSEASIRWLDQSIQGSGVMSLTGASPSLDFHWNVEQASLATLLSAAGYSSLPVSGALTATAAVQGSIDNPIVTAQAKASDLNAYSEPLGDLNARIDLRSNLLRIEHAELDKPASNPLRAAGSFHLETGAYQLSAFAQGFVLTGPAVRGEFDLDAKGSGTMRDPGVTLDIHARGLRVRDADIGRIDGKAVIERHQARFEAAAPEHSASVRGSIGIRDPFDGQAELKLNATALAKLPLKLRQPIEGVLSATINATGSARNWEQAELAARVESFDVRWNGQPIRSEAPFTARYANRTLEVDPVAIQAAGSTLRLFGKLPLEGTRPGAVEIDGTLDLPGILKLAAVDTKAAIAGQASISGTLRGSLKRITPELAVQLKNGSAALPDTQPVTGIAIEAAFRDGVIRWNRAAAQWASAGIESQGTAPLGLFLGEPPFEIPRGSGPAKFTADVTNLNLATLSGAPASVTGKASLHLDAEASKPDITSITGTLTIPEFQVNLDRLALTQRDVSTISIRNGVARVEKFELSGNETFLKLEGTTGLTGDRALDAKASGAFDIGILSSFVSGARVQGPVKLDITAKGTVKEPRFAGFLELADGRLSATDPSLAAENLHLRVDLQGDRLEIGRFEGSLNGGALSGSGSARLARGQLRDTQLRLRAENVYLSFPFGFKTLSTSEVTLRNVADSLRLGGAVLIHEGSFTDRLTLETGLPRYLQSGQTSTSIGEKRNQLLAGLNYDVGILTLAPLVVDNNLAKAEASMHLRLRGNYYRPGLTGRVTIEEGGELFLSEKKYLIDRGLITFNNELEIDPELDILARTQASAHDITMRISGGGGEKIQTALASVPTLPEPDIIALLLTGRRLDQLQGSEAAIAREQALSYLAGSVGAQLTGNLERATGLSRVRIEPNLIANESDPSARLTVGQDLTQGLRVIYSMNLANGGDQIYVAEYDVARRFLTRAVKQADNTYRMELRHDIQFGGTAPSKTTRGTLRGIGTVSFAGTPEVPDSILAGRFKVKPGRRYDFFRIRAGLERLDKLYTSRSQLESRIRLKREETKNLVHLTINIIAGPKVDFVFEGWAPSGNVRAKVRRAWHDGVFDAQRIEESVSHIRDALILAGYTDPVIQPAVTADAAAKRVLFDIRPGARNRDGRMVFAGSNAIGSKELRQRIESEKLESAVYSNPTRVTQAITQVYRDAGYLDVTVAPPVRESGNVVVRIREGVRFVVGDIRFTGNKALSADDLYYVLPFDYGEPLAPAHHGESVNRMLDLYTRKGFTAASIDIEAERSRRPGRIDVTFRITENEQRVIAGITIEGNSQTSKKLIGSQVSLKPGEPLDLKQLSKSRRDLYNTGAFQVVDVDREEQPAAAAGRIPVNLHLKVREIRPFELKYGLYYDTERGPGGIIDFANRNSLGSARVIGFRARFDSDLREARAYFSQPLLRVFPVRSIAAGFSRRELREDFITDRIGVSLQQEARPWEKWVINYGWRMEHVHIVEREPDPIIPFDVTLRIAPLTTSLSRDTRDDLFDATRGSLASSALEWAPATLGSQLRFVRYYGQYFRYFPLSKPELVPLAGLRRSRLVFATAFRAGIAGGLGGQELIPSERFFAGGGTTIRGFRQDTAGSPEGGNALLILNNEIRFPIKSIFDGVAFTDIGNVYRRAADFSLSDLRKSAGFGVRVRTPYFLLRFDYGMKIGRRPGETFGQFFFSIGQAF